MASTSDTVFISAECLCKTHTFNTKVSTSQLPLKVSVCHCTSCRHLTGALYSSDTPWPGSRQEVLHSTLKTYQFSPNIQVLFCGTCSTPMFWNNNNNPEDPGVFTGCLSNVDADLVRIVSHIFVGDTIDGGATCWLRMPNEDGSEAKRFQKRQDGQEFPAEWPDTSTLKGYETHSEEEFLPIHCHCNGVNLRLYRGNYIGKPKEELPWFIDDKNLKQIASFDACDSCRSHCGIDILNWTFASLQNISFTNSTSKFPATMHELKAAIDAQDHNLGTLGYYQSSPNVHRHFCKVCSATVFFARDERPDIVDIAVGLLDSADGARAEGFLSWTLGGGVAFADDFKGGWREGMLKQVVKESEEWRVKRGYPKNRRRVEADEKAAK